MALTINTIPSQVPYPPAPYDATNAFASAQTLTATGYVNNLNAVLPLGGTVPVLAAGRTEGLWCMNITAIDFSSADESYKLHLFGSNDAAFGNGNVDLLSFFDLAAVTRHPDEWSLAPWPVDKTNAWRQKDYDRRVKAAEAAGLPPPAEPPELSLSPEAQAELDQDAKNREEAQKIVDEADKRAREAREWDAKVAAARATLAAAPVQPAQLATATDAADVAADSNTDIPRDWRDWNNARRRGLAQRLGAPRDIKQAKVNGYIEAEERRRANSTQSGVQAMQVGASSGLTGTSDKPK